MEDLTPMMKQYHEVKRRFPGKLVFFRLGDFYEMFYEDAVVAARELEITLTARNKDKIGLPDSDVWCSVPFRRWLHRSIAEERIQDCDLRTGRRSADGEEARAA